MAGTRSGFEHHPEVDQAAAAGPALLASPAVANRDVGTLVGELARRDAARTEAMVQADIRELLLTAPLGLYDHHVVELEAQVGDGRRIDVEVGFTVIEVKKDLRKGSVRDDEVEQLAGYVCERSHELSQRYVDVLTNGAEWRAYHVADDVLTEVATITVKPSRPDLDGLLVWLVHPDNCVAVLIGSVPPIGTDLDHDIDTIVKQVRLTGWNETQEGDRTVHKEFRPEGVRAVGHRDGGRPCLCIRS